MSDTGYAFTYLDSEDQWTRECDGERFKSSEEGVFVATRESVELIPWHRVLSVAVPSTDKWQGCYLGKMRPSSSR